MRTRLTTRWRRGAAATCAGVAAVLAAAGCGAGAGGHGHAATSATASRPAARSPATSTTATSTTTSTTTTSSTTTTQLPGAGGPTITIGDKNYDEQFVLGQLYLQALKAQGFSVNITANIGPPSVIEHALKSGSLAMYPEYLNTFDQTLAHVRRTFTTRAAALAAARRWARRHALTLLAPTPFSDTDAIVVTAAYAARHRLRTLGDLSRVGAGLTLGGAAQFSADRIGVSGLSEVYGVTLESFKALPIGAQYTALDAGTVQAAYVNSTDGQLIGGDYRMLGDPRHLFGFGNVIPVVSSAALAKEGPAFAATIERVDRTLTLPAMRALNAGVTVAHETAAAVANVFLETHGLLDPLRRHA